MGSTRHSAWIQMFSRRQEVRTSRACKHLIIIRTCNLLRIWADDFIARQPELAELVKFCVLSAWIRYDVMLCTFCLQESRTLKFWFAADTDYLDKITSAYDFFKELVKPDQFPRGKLSEVRYEIHVRYFHPAFVYQCALIRWWDVKCFPLN